MPTIDCERYTREEDFKRLETGVDEFSTYVVKIFEDHRKRIHELEMVVIAQVIGFVVLAVAMIIGTN